MSEDPPKADGGGAEQSPERREQGNSPKPKRLGVRGYARAVVIQRTAAVSWPEAKQMARRNQPDPAGPTDVVSDAERERNRP
jgi:hypothetical protein